MVNLPLSSLALRSYIEYPADTPQSQHFSRLLQVDLWTRDTARDAGSALDTEDVLRHEQSPERHVAAN